MSAVFYYGADSLTVASALAIANGTCKGLISQDTAIRVKRSQSDVEHIVSSGRTVYGINTGFGILANTAISASDTATLQHKILQSHSVGVGESLPTEVAKLMLITKAHALAKGYSGIRLSTLERIVWHIDHNVIPVVPEKGSVGASGDLSPLSHLFLPLIGLGELWVPGAKEGSYDRVSATDYLAAKGVDPLTLGPKEGLALINGTQFILSFAIKAVQRLHNCLEAADIIGSMSLEALTGTNAPFDARLHALRPYAGNQLVAQRLRLLLQDSAIRVMWIAVACKIHIHCVACLRCTARLVTAGCTWPS
jgi:histidine ammonia-lyase